MKIILLRFAFPNYRILPTHPLIIVVFLKYSLLVMKCDQHGEGGVLVGASVAEATGAGLALAVLSFGDGDAVAEVPEFSFAVGTYFGTVTSVPV